MWQWILKLHLINTLVTPIKDDDIENIKKSIDILMNSDIDYEFRTTFDPHLTSDDIEKIANNKRC